MVRIVKGILSAAVALALGLAGCGGSAPAGSAPAASATAPPPTSTLVYTLDSTGVNKIPAFTTAGEDTDIIRQIYDSLLQVDADGKIQPGLATNYSVSPDGKTWTFQLRQGVKWQGGYGEFTCADVKFTWDLLRDPAQKSFWMNQASIVDSVSCPDPYQAVIQLKAPFQGFIWNLVNIEPSTGWVMSKAAWDKLGKGGYSKTPIGTGPYMWKSMVPNQDVILVRNPDYWGAKPGVDRIDFKDIADYQTAALGVKTGSIDIAAVDPVTASQYQNTPGVRVVTKHGLSIDWLELNTTWKPFDDVRVRQAVGYAIDYQGLVKTVLRGFGAPGYAGSFLPGITGFDASVDPQNTHDLAKAKQLLGQAGVTLPIKGFFTTYNDTEDVDAAQYIAADLAQAGIDLQARPLERGTLTQVRIQPGTPASILGTTLSPDPDFIGSHFISSYDPPAGLNIPRYSGIDQLYKEQHLAPTASQRLVFLRQMQQKLAQDMPTVMVYSRDDIWLVNDRVQNFNPTALYTGQPLQFVTLSAK